MEWFLLIVLIIAAVWLPCLFVMGINSLYPGSKYLMSNTTKKKKAFKASCRAQVFKGLINQADGSWSVAGTGTMARHMQAGYRMGLSKRKAKIKQEVE